MRQRVSTKMSKLLVICVLLGTVASSFVQADNLVELHLENPVTLTSDGYLYTIWKTNTSIYLNSTKDDLKPCKIDIDPVKDSTVTKLQGKELLNNKFVIWAFRSYDRNRDIVSLNYTALIVDPLSCTYKAVSIPEEHKLSDHWPLFNSRVLPSTDGFDFFYPSHGKCSPCRFTLQGEPIPLKYQLEPEEEVFIPYGFQIQSLDESDLSKGYVYALNFKNDTAVIKYLDSKFKVLKQALLQHPIHSLSVNYNKQPIISICYASHNFLDSVKDNNFKVDCEQLDSDLKSKFTVHLPVPGDQFVFGLTGLTHQVDSYGNMFIGLMQCTPKIGPLATRQLRFFASDSDGKLIDTHDYDKSSMQNRSEWFELRSHLSDNKTFCVVTDVVPTISSTDTHEVITCTDVSKYQN